MACPGEQTCHSSYPSEYKLVGAVNKVGYGMRLLSDFLIGSILLGSTRSRLVDNSRSSQVD